jgi:hypothetical protein
MFIVAYVAWLVHSLRRKWTRDAAAGTVPNLEQQGEAELGTVGVGATYDPTATK